MTPTPTSCTVAAMELFFFAAMVVMAWRFGAFTHRWVGKYRAALAYERREGRS